MDKKERNVIHQVKSFADFMTTMSVLWYRYTLVYSKMDKIENEYGECVKGTTTRAKSRIKPKDLNY